MSIYSLTPTWLTVQVVVELAPQTIAFAPIPDQFTTNRPTLEATASSGLPVVFSVLSGPAFLAGNSLSFSGPGDVEVVAEQNGSLEWQPADPVTNRFEVLLTPVVIVWDTPAPALVGMPLGPDQLNASSGTPGDFTYDPPEGAILPDGTNLLRAILTPSNAAIFAVTTGAVEWILEPYIQIRAGEVVLRRGESGQIPVTITAAGRAYTGGVGRITFLLEVETNRFSSFALGVDPLIATLNAAAISNQLIAVTVEAIPGERLADGANAVLVGVTMPVGQTSQVVPLRMLEPGARDLTGGDIPRVFGESGRAVLVGDQPILDAPERDGTFVRIPVFIAPGQWAAERSMDLGPSGEWEQIGLLEDIQVITNFTMEVGSEPLRLFRMRQVESP